MEGSGYLKERDKIKLQEKELTALDGLWFLEVEKEWATRRPTKSTGKSGVVADRSLSVK